LSESVRNRRKKSAEKSGQATSTSAFFVVIYVTSNFRRSFVRAALSLCQLTVREDAMGLVLRRTALFIGNVLAWALLVSAVVHSAIRSKRRGNNLSWKRPGIPVAPE